MPVTRDYLRPILAAFLAGATCAAFSVGAQNAPATAAATPAATTFAPDAVIDEIVITGMRASLEKSLEMKKNSAVVQDSINALELGRFPDADVADSLSHLPGITISRTTGGEGMRINVQGLGPQYNLVTLNNRILATDDDGRELNEPVRKEAAEYNQRFTFEHTAAEDGEIAIVHHKLNEFVRHRDGPIIANFGQYTTRSLAILCRYVGRTEPYNKNVPINH